MAAVVIKAGSRVLGLQTAPLPPTDLIATAMGQTQIDLSWVPPTEGAPVRGYRIERSADAGATWAQAGTTTAPTTTQLSDGYLTPGVAYTYRVRSTGIVLLSAPSATATATTDASTAPVASFTGAPLNIQAGSSVAFANASTNYASSSWSFGDGGTSSLDSPTYQYATAGTYTVALTVTGPGGTDTQTRVGYVTVTPVPASPNLTSAAVGSNGTRWTLVFDATVTGHTGFTFRNGAGTALSASYVSGEGTDTLLFDVGLVYSGDTPTLSYAPGDVQHSSTPLSPFSGFQATNDSAQSPGDVTPPTVGASPSIDATGLVLTVPFSEAVTGTTGFSVTVGGVPVSLTYTGGSGTSSYTYALARVVLGSETVKIGYAPGTVADASGNPLAPFSNRDVTNNSTQSVAGAPGAPTNLIATGASGSQISLSWTLADATDTTVRVQRSASGANSWQTIAALAGGNVFHPDPGPLVNSTTYDYRVRAENAAGASAWATTSGTTTSGNYNGASLVSFTATTQSAFRVRLAWTAPSVISGGAANVVLYRSADGGATYSKIRVQGVVVNTAYTYDDYPLASSTAYQYQIRILTASNYGSFLSASATTNSQGSPPGTPYNLSKTELSDTQCLLAWELPDAGSSVLIETSPIPGTGSPTNATWTQVAETAVGATTYVLPTTSRACRYWRVRAKNGVGNGEYTTPNADLTIRPPAPGSPQTYHIGVGQTYTSLAAFAAAVAPNLIPPGSTIYIHSGTYNEKFVIMCRGTPGAPITFEGVDDGGGYPEIDGYLAVQPAQSVTPNNTTFGGLSLVLFHRRSTEDIGVAPGWITFKNFTVRRGSGDNSPSRQFVNNLGELKNYADEACGIYVASGDHITIQNCRIIENGSGIFASWRTSDERYISDLTIRGNYFAGNGKVSSYLSHSCYIEGNRTLYEYNWFGPKRPGAAPAHIKDRGPGTIIRYNRLDKGTLRPLDVVEAQDSFARTFLLPEYDTPFVYGNLITNETTIPLHYGLDSSSPESGRGGAMRFYHNTFVTHADNTVANKVVAFYLNHFRCACVAINNVIYTGRVTPTAFDPSLELLTNNNTSGSPCYAHFLANWVKSTWRPTGFGQTFIGVAYGTSNFVTNEGNLPDFASLGTGDYRILENSASAAAGSRIPSDWPPVDREYVHPMSSQARATWGAGSALGYTAAVPDTTAPTVSKAELLADGGTFDITFSENVTSDGTGFTLTATGGPVTLTYQGGSGTNVLRYVANRVIVLSETLTLAYAPGNVCDRAATPNSLAAFSGFAGTNSSEETSAGGFRVASSATNGAPSPASALTITRPIGVEVGDVLVASLFVGGAPTVTVPSGWTQVTFQADAFGAGRCYVWWKAATGSEPSDYTWSFSAANQVAGGIARVAGADPVTPVNAFSKNAPAGAASQVASAVTTTVDGCLLLRFVGLDRSSVIGTPANHVRKWDREGRFARSLLYMSSVSTAGSSGTATFTSSDSRPLAFVNVALNPAGG